MPRAATAFVEFEGDFSRIQNATKGQAKGLEKTFGTSFKNIAKGAALSIAAFGAAKVFKDAFSQAENAAKVGKQTEAVLKSTGGVAGVTAKQVDTLATSLSKKAAVDDEVIKSGENVLLTFTNIKNEAGKGNDIFDQATEAATNLSSALGQDMQSSVIQLGKALNDPIKGVTALQRVGVSFTKKQKEQIKVLVDSGKTLQAQKLILGELTKEFGGAAAAAATPSERLKVAVGNLEESLGTLLVPAVAKISVALAGLAEWVDRNRGLATALAAAVAALVTAFVGMLVISKVVKTVQAFRVAMTALNATFLANPVVLVVAGIVALGVAVFIAYKKFKPFHDAVDRLWQLLQSLFHWVQRNWPLLLAILTGPFGLAVLFIKRHLSGIMDVVRSIPGKIGGAFKNVATVLTAPFRGAFNAIATLWNRTIGKLSFKIPSWVPGVGGKGFDVPDIPTFAGGGVMSKTGLALLHAGENVFTPQQLGAVRGSIDASININGNVIDFDDLNRFADERDHKLAAVLGAGAR